MITRVKESKPVADYLSGTVGGAILAEYRFLLEGKFKSQKAQDALDVLKYEDGVVKGSNPYAATFMNQVLERRGLRLAAPGDLERLLKGKKLEIQSHYHDLALVLRNEEGHNGYLAENLSEQLREERRPVMLPLEGLYLVEDEKAPHGLAFRLKEEAQEIYAPQLVGGNTRKKFSKTDENGLPILGRKGKRTLLTEGVGLSRVCYFRSSHIASGNFWSNLDISYSEGRIVVVGGPLEQVRPKKITISLADRSQEEDEMMMMLSGLDGAKFE